MAAPRAKPEVLAPEDVFPPTSQAPAQPLQVIQPEPDDNDVALLNIIADLGGATDAKVNVYKAQKGSRDMAYVGSYEAADFSLDSLKLEYGGGSYRIHVRRDGQLVANRLLTVADPRNPIIAPPAPAINPADLMNTMQQGFAQLGQTLLQGIAQLIPQPKPEKTTADMLKEMMLIKELLAPPQSAAPAVDAFATFKQGMEFAQSIQPREGDVGTNEILLEGLKVLSPVLGQALQKPAFNPQQAGPGVVPPTMQLPAPLSMQAVGPTPTPPISQPEPQPAGAPEMSLQEKMFFNTIIAAAKADADPSTYSALVLDLIGNEQALQLVSLPDWFEQLVAREPRAFAFKPWFEEMRENIYLLTETPLPAINDGNANSMPLDADSGQPAQPSLPA